MAEGDRDRLVALRRAISRIGPDLRRAARLRDTLSRYLIPYRADALPTMRGVYLIGSDRLFTGESPSCYIGLSANIHARFVGGHWRDGGTRADALIKGSEVVYAVGVRTVDLVAAEVLLYILARRAGLNPLNSVSHLGLVGSTDPAPVVSCRLSDGRLRLHESTTAASRDLQIRHAIPSALFRYQNAAGGHTFRWATDAEIATGSPRSEGSDANFNGRLFHWTTGGVPEELRSAFSRSSSYSRRRSGYYGVTRSDRAPGFWTARLVEIGGCSNNPGIALGRRFVSEREAYEAREVYLASHPELLPHNRRGRYGELVTTSTPRRRS